MKMSLERAGSESRNIEGFFEFAHFNPELYSFEYNCPFS